ncbi:hypothetical protein VNI00_004433 [Paramarasmius palmivorus]|uniref:Uncharacterized protein n=1 Tax=Paramarasmius palmivorus TaxID=297713 RepID=A0AAW0DKD2_9AGAR
MTSPPAYSSTAPAVTINNRIEAIASTNRQQRDTLKQSFLDRLDEIRQGMPTTEHKRVLRQVLTNPQFQSFIEEALLGDLMRFGDVQNIWQMVRIRKALKEAYLENSKLLEEKVQHLIDTDVISVLRGTRSSVWDDDDVEQTPNFSFGTDRVRSDVPIPSTSNSVQTNSNTSTETASTSSPETDVTIVVEAIAVDATDIPGTDNPRVRVTRDEYELATEEFDQRIRRTLGRSLNTEERILTIPVIADVIDARRRGIDPAFRFAMGEVQDGLAQPVDQTAPEEDRRFPLVEDDPEHRPIQSTWTLGTLEPLANILDETPELSPVPVVSVVVKLGTSPQIAHRSDAMFADESGQAIIRVSVQNELDPIIFQTTTTTLTMQVSLTLPENHTETVEEV